MVQELGENRSARVHSPFLHLTYFSSRNLESRFRLFDSSDFKSKKTKTAFNPLPCIRLAGSLKPSSGQYCLYNIHFKGVFFLTQKLLPLINDGGRIINVSSGLTRIILSWFSVKWRSSVIR